MPAKFDWRAEDDSSWDEFAGDGGDENKSSPRRSRPRWLVAGGVILILIAGSVLAFYQVRRYVDNTAASVEDDVASSHELVELAARESDLELLAPLLSGRDPEWTQAQLTLLDTDLFYNRKPFGLYWQPAEAEAEKELFISLSPDLQSAEVEYIESFGYGPGGQGGTVQLRQTAVYRLSETRWLLSPPLDDFWGSWISSSGRFVTLTFPERDSDIGRRLAADLEATITGVCLTLELDCSQSPPLEMLLATDPGSLLYLTTPKTYSTEEEQLILPAPTLIGKPANDAGYRVLYRQYALWLVTFLVAKQADWPCCPQPLFFKALVDVQLHQAGLQSWPLGPEQYRLALRQPVNLADVRSLWDEEPALTVVEEHPDWWMTYALVEFLLNRENAGPALERQRSLARVNSFNGWLAEFNVSGSLNLFERDWTAFVQQRIIQSQSQPSVGQPQVGLPEDDIALVCNDGQTAAANVYRYQPAENRWSLELPDRDFVIMNGLPGNQGLILTEQFLDTDELRTTLWRDGRETVVSFGDTFYISSGVTDPAGRYLVLLSFQQVTFSSNAYLLDLENCQDGDCSLLPLAGVPEWSPDGSRTIWIAPIDPANPQEERPIFIGDSQGQSQPGLESVYFGEDPFWLDNETFAFLQSADGGFPGSAGGNAAQQERPPRSLVIVGFNEQEIRTLVEPGDLLEQLPELEESELDLLEAVADPNMPGFIFITAANRSEEEDYLFVYDRAAGELTLAQTIERKASPLSLEGFPSNHRWLILRSFNAGNSTSDDRREYTYLYDTQSQALLSYTLNGNTVLMESWSANEEWLMFRGDGFLILSNPASDYDHLVTYSFADCTGAAWIE